MDAKELAAWLREYIKGRRVVSYEKLYACADLIESLTANRDSTARLTRELSATVFGQTVDGTEPTLADILASVQAMPLTADQQSFRDELRIALMKRGEAQAEANRIGQELARLREPWAGLTEIEAFSLRALEEPGTSKTAERHVTIALHRLMARLAVVEPVRKLAMNWALCQSAMNDLDKRGEVSDAASKEWNAWMRLNREASDLLLAWCINDADADLVASLKSDLDKAAQAAKGE